MHPTFRPFALLAVLALALPARAATGPTPEARAFATEAAAERHSFTVWRVRFADATTARRAAISHHDAVLESDWPNGTLVMALDEAEQARLAPHALSFEAASEFMARREAMLSALQAQARPRLLGAEAAAAPGAIPGYACYETVGETHAAAAALVAAHPHLARYLPIGPSWEKTAGQGGWDLQVLRLSNEDVEPPPGQDKPRLFINAAIHAREYVTAPLALAFATELLQGHGQDADATWLLDHHEIHLLLHTNPDGRQKAETGLWWRKNTNQAYCGAQSPSRGADLNRNFSHSWNVTNGRGSSGNPCAETYRGPAAASEPETQAIEAYVRTLWPDRRRKGQQAPAPADTSGVHIDLHSYGRLVLWPWGFTAQPTGNAIALQTLGRRFAFHNGHFPEQSIGLYPTDGTSDSISYGELGVAAYTFEMGDSFFQDCTSYAESIKPGNLAALRYAARVVRAPYQLPSGPDTLNTRLLEAAVPAGTPARLRARIDATRFSQANGQEPTPAVAAAQAFVGTPPWWPGAVAIPLKASDGAFDSPKESVQGRLPTQGLPPGRHLVWVQGIGANGQAGPFSATFLTVR